MNLDGAVSFVWRDGRLLERAMLAQTLNLEPPGRVGDVLRAYATADGGFGYGLEADVCAPESQPLFLEFALTVLHDWGLRAPDLATAACRYLEGAADLERGIVTLHRSARAHAYAPHWEAPGAYEPATDRLVGIVGLLNWQGISDPWLARAVEACRRHIAALRADDAHTIRGMLILLESLSLQGADVTAERARLAALLARARFLIREAPVQGYGLTPLDFTPAPDGWCRDLFTETQYAGHLADLAGRQGPDGGWPITWEPPGEAAGWVWRAHVTVRALAVLRAWGMA